jgi:hypothetical protein
MSPSKSMLQLKWPPITTHHQHSVALAPLTRTQATAKSADDHQRSQYNSTVARPPGQAVHHCCGTRRQPRRIRFCHSCTALNRSIRRGWPTRSLPSSLLLAFVTSHHLACRLSPALVIRTTSLPSRDLSQASSWPPSSLCAGLESPHMPVMP